MESAAHYTSRSSADLMLLVNYFAIFAFRNNI